MCIYKYIYKHFFVFVFVYNPPNAYILIDCLVYNLKKNVYNLKNNLYFIFYKHINTLNKNNKY